MKREENFSSNVKHSSLLKLDTPEGVKSGHSDCKTFMENMVKELLQPTIVDPSAQSLLLDETPEVFDDEDRAFFSKVPTFEETKASVWGSNLTGSPGYDGIISLFHKVHWILVGELLNQLVLENCKRKTLTNSQSIGLINFCRKPKKR